MRSLKNVCPAIREIFDTNPYCVLGISVLSSREKALEVKDELEVLEKLKKIGDYSSPFVLKEVQAPDRESDHVQVVLPGLSDIQYKWLWFANEPLSSSRNRRTSGTEGEGVPSYDGMLACIIA